MKPIYHVPGINDDICIQDVCDRLEGTVQRATAILNGDIQEAKGWLLKYEAALCELAKVKSENSALKDKLAALKND